MKSRIVQAAVVSAVVLGVALVGGAAARAWWLVALAVAGQGLAVLVLLADTNRRLRAVQKSLAEGTFGEASAVSAGVSEADVLGTVRLLQAQYTGRLDRLQHAVEEIAAATRRDATP